MFGYYWQHTMTWCGPACAQMVLYRLGLYVPTQKTVADLMGAVSGRGTDSGSVCKGLRMLGVNTRIVPHYLKEWNAAINNNGEVLIVATTSRIRGVPHWIIIDRYNPDMHLVHTCDPAWVPMWENDVDLKDGLIDAYGIGCRRL